MYGAVMKSVQSVYQAKAHLSSLLAEVASTGALSGGRCHLVVFPLTPDTVDAELQTEGQAFGAFVIVGNWVRCL